MRHFVEKGAAYFTISATDRELLRPLGERMADIARHPVNDERKRLWQKVNDLQGERPMIWYNDIPWHELDVDGELDLQCSGAYAREVEQELRQTLYQWTHFSGDMVVSPFLVCYKRFTNTMFGIEEKVDLALTDESSEIVSRHFHIQMAEEADIDKIQMPQVRYLREETEASHAALEWAFTDVLPIQVVGQQNIWYTPWDFLVRWMGVDESLLALYDKPEWVHRVYERMVDVYCSILDQFEAQGLLSLDNSNCQVGSGAYGYVSDLPGTKEDPDPVRPCHMWGCANAQILDVVSPQMHWEFALAHDMRWISRFGLTYYGCCEALDKKLDLMRRIPNLRKISVSPWADMRRAVEGIGKDYVISHKPNPAIMATEAFQPEEAKSTLEAYRDMTRGLSTECILKDISTVKYDPKRLWEWDAIAKRCFGA